MSPESTSPKKFSEEFTHSLRDKLIQFGHELRRLVNAMPDSHEEIEKIAKHIQEIDRAVAQLAREHHHDPADIIHHIIHQPLSVPGSPTAVSLLKAAQSFHKENPYESDFFKILSIFHEYPGPTHTLIAELDILIHELK
jgi:hypothetical protein